MLYHMTLDELIEYDFDEQQAQQMIDSVSDEAQARIDWNKVWSKKYPVLGTYHQTVRIDDYAAPPCGSCSPSCKWTTATITPTPYWSSKTFWPEFGKVRYNGSPTHYAPDSAPVPCTAQRRGRWCCFCQSAGKIRSRALPFAKSSTSLSK